MVLTAEISISENVLSLLGALYGGITNLSIALTYANFFTRQNFLTTYMATCVSHHTCNYSVQVYDGVETLLSSTYTK